MTLCVLVDRQQLGGEKYRSMDSDLCGSCKTFHRNISHHLPEYTMSYPRRPTTIKPQTLLHFTIPTCAIYEYYVSVFVSARDRRWYVSSKADGMQLRPLDPWRDLSQVDVHSVRHGEHADRFCSSSLTTPYSCSLNNAIHNQVTAMYYLFTELVRLEVALTQITDPCIPWSSHIPTGLLC